MARDRLPRHLDPADMGMWRAQTRSTTRKTTPPVYSSLLLALKKAEEQAKRLQLQAS